MAFREKSKMSIIFGTNSNDNVLVFCQCLEQRRVIVFSITRWYGSCPYWNKKIFLVRFPDVHLRLACCTSWVKLGSYMLLGIGMWIRLWLWILPKKVFVRHKKRIDSHFVEVSFDKNVWDWNLFMKILCCSFCHCC